MPRRKQEAKENPNNLIARKKLLAQKMDRKKSEKNDKSGVKTSAKDPVVKRPRRFKPGTIALREIKKYQKSTELVLQKAPLQRVIKSIMHAYNAQLRMSSTGALIIQEAVEAHIISLLADCNLCAQHARRVSIQPKDFYLARRIRGKQGEPVPTHNVDPDQTNE